ncbi:hypothetical protein FRB93_005474 [Tulasnella sp. JGI-2019a]|nr:hypothetical protein FRB93_005474 [Tulasnella sp. JGI-2019a]
MNPPAPPASIMSINDPKPSRIAAGNFPMPRAPVNHSCLASRKPTLAIGDSHRHAFRVVLPWAESPAADTSIRSPLCAIPSSPPQAPSDAHDPRPAISRHSIQQSNAGPSSPRHRDSDSGIHRSPRHTDSRTPGGKGRPRSMPKTPKPYVWTMPIGGQSLPIFDPDFPNGLPTCNSPRDPPLKRDYFEVAALHDVKIEEVRRQTVLTGEDPGGMPTAGKKEGKLPVSEISVFGRVGELEDVFGLELPSPGLLSPGATRRLSCRSSLRSNDDSESVRTSRTD